jgi:hypothetical protein
MINGSVIRVVPDEAAVQRVNAVLMREYAIREKICSVLRKYVAHEPTIFKWTPGIGPVVLQEVYKSQPWMSERFKGIEWTVHASTLLRVHKYQMQILEVLRNSLMPMLAIMWKYARESNYYLEMRFCRCMIFPSADEDNWGAALGMHDKACEEYGKQALLNETAQDPEKLEQAASYPGANTWWTNAIFHWLQDPERIRVATAAAEAAEQQTNNCFREIFHEPPGTTTAISAVVRLEPDGTAMQIVHSAFAHEYMIQEAQRAKCTDPALLLVYEGRIRLLKNTEELFGSTLAIIGGCKWASVYALERAICLCSTCLSESDLYKIWIEVLREVNMTCREYTQWSFYGGPIEWISFDGLHMQDPERVEEARLDAEAAEQEAGGWARPIFNKVSESE